MKYHLFYQSKYICTYVCTLHMRQLSLNFPKRAGQKTYCYGVHMVAER